MKGVKVFGHEIPRQGYQTQHHVNVPAVSTTQGIASRARLFATDDSAFESSMVGGGGGAHESQDEEEGPGETHHF